MTAKIWTDGGERYTLETAPAEVRDAIRAAHFDRGRVSGRITIDGVTYRWGDLRSDDGSPMRDERSYGGERKSALPEWMRTNTGA